MWTFRVEPGGVTPILGMYVAGSREQALEAGLRALGYSCVQTNTVGTPETFRSVLVKGGGDAVVE